MFLARAMMEEMAYSAMDEGEYEGTRPILMPLALQKSTGTWNESQIEVIPIPRDSQIDLDGRSAKYTHSSCNWTYILDCQEGSAIYWAK